jgi:hypothetical protein
MTETVGEKGGVRGVSHGGTERRRKVTDTAWWERGILSSLLFLYFRVLRTSVWLIAS